MTVAMCYLKEELLPLRAHFKNLELISGTWVGPVRLVDVP